MSQVDRKPKRNQPRVQDEGRIQENKTGRWPDGFGHIYLEDIFYSLINFDWIYKSYIKKTKQIIK